ncbi:MAG TPA: hypothetical protein VMW67_03150, partial [Desulfobacteria bacterium]|nr:hypothetical protein [Desulfobacteria bacterium]
PPILPIKAASRVRTNDIDFSSWASHTITERIIYTPYYNKLSCVRTIPISLGEIDALDLLKKANKTDLEMLKLVTEKLETLM